MLVAIGVELGCHRRRHRPHRRAHVAERAAEQPPQQPVELARPQGTGAFAPYRHHHVVAPEGGHEARQLGRLGRRVGGKRQHRGVAGGGETGRQRRRLARRLWQRQNFDRLATLPQLAQRGAGARLRPVQDHDDAERPAERRETAAIAGYRIGDVGGLARDRDQQQQRLHRGQGRLREIVHPPLPTGLAAITRKARRRPAAVR